MIAAVAELPRPLLELEQLESARRGAPPDAEYTFKHALVQDAAYGTMLREKAAAVTRADRRELAAAE